MAKSKTLFGPRAVIGCLLLFALPFIAAGAFMTWKSYQTLLAYRALAAWVEVPATITGVRLAGKRMTAGYTYEFAGRKFNGNRIALDSQSLTIGGIQRMAYSELKHAADTGRPFRAFVDPQRPEESVLYRQLPWQLMAFFTLFGATFGAAGLGLLTAGVIGTLRGPRLCVANDDEPWRARSDWAARRILPKTSAWVAPAVLTVVALWWWLSIAPLLSILSEQLGQRFNPWLVLPLLCPILGLVWIAMLIYTTLRASKFGDSYFELAGETGVVGGQLAGVVRIPAAVDASQGFCVRLTALEFIQRPKHSSTEALWQEEQFVSQPLVDPAGRTTAVPVLFAVPFDAPETSGADGNRNIHWELEVSAATSGVDYLAQFAVPVFRTAESRRDFQLDRSLTADFAPPPDARRVIQDAGLRLQTAPDGGTHLVVPMARNWSTAIIATLFAGSMAVVAWLLWHVGIFFLVPLVLVMVALFVAYLALDLWFYKSTVDASPAGLAVRGGLFGLGRTHRATPKEFQRFTSREYMSSGRNVWCTISIKPRNRPRITIAKGIRRKLLERAIIEELEAALGRDTA